MGAPSDLYSGRPPRVAWPTHRRKACQRAARLARDARTRRLERRLARRRTR